MCNKICNRAGVKLLQSKHREKHNSQSGSQELRWGFDDDILKESAKIKL